MTVAHEVMSLLFEAAPELADVVPAVEPEPDGRRLIYLEMSELARCLLDAKRANHTSVIEAVLTRVEELLTGAHERVRDLLIVGLLEDIQNALLHEAMPLDEWERWLGPQALAGWPALIKMWNSDIKHAEFNAFIRGGAA